MCTNIKKNVNLAQFSTFKIGGKAKFYFEIKNKNDLSFAINFTQKNKEKLYILGGGSNILINNKNIDGVVIRFCNNNIRVNDNEIFCDAGATLLNVLNIGIKNGLSGLEWSLGIPRATIGGSIYGNSGGFNTYMSYIVKSVEVFDVKNKKFIELNNKQCHFSHKNSIFKNNNNYLIWSAILLMKKNSPERIKIQSKNNLKIRQKTQDKFPNIGCIFKNISIRQVEKDNKKLAERLVKNNIVKNNVVSVGWVIDSLKLKGKIIGDAKISEKHANFIINIGNATSFDIISLIKYIKEKVKNEYNINLEEEIQYIGFNDKI